MREIYMGGSPYEMGLQHGQQARDLIHAFYAKSFAVGPGDLRGYVVDRDTPEQVEAAARIEHSLRQRLPHLLEEIRGIGDGAEMAFAQMLRLNLFCEIWNLSRRGCTNIAVNGPDGPLLANTADVDAGDESYLVAQRYEPAEGHRFLQVGYAGTVWTNLGINEHGLTQAGTALKPLAENWDGLPILLVTRELFRQCRTVEEAIAFLGDHDCINHGAGVLVVDRQGAMAVIEKVPTRQAVRQGKGDLLFNGNHALCSEINGLVGGSALIANSQARCANLTRIAERHPATLADLQAILRDHASPGAICQHGQTGLHTASGAVAVCARGELWATAGYPCQNPFEQFVLSSTT